MRTMKRRIDGRGRLGGVSRWTLAMTVLFAATLSGCGKLVSKAGAGVSRNLTAGVLDQDDVLLVADGLPAYLLMVDGLIHGDPEASDLLLSGSRLYGAYAGGFAGNDMARRKRLALRAEAYARRAICAAKSPLCAVLDKPYDEFAAVVAQQTAKDVPQLYALATAWAGVLQADTADWDRIAQLPQIEALLLRVREFEPAYDYGSNSMYLGVLNCLRPESLGGKPEQGKRYFEQALEQSGGKNQMARVLEAEYCARLLFDQELHDSLIDEALAADPRAPGLTLINTLAQQRGRELKASGKDYF